VEEVRDQSDDKSAIASLCYQLRRATALAFEHDISSQRRRFISLYTKQTSAPRSGASHASLRKRLTSHSCHPKSLLSPLRLTADSVTPSSNPSSSTLRQTQIPLASSLPPSPSLPLVHRLQKPKSPSSLSRCCQIG
jgi:hypothetical protein